MNIIDSHVHFFNLQEGKYQWLFPENPPFWNNKSSLLKPFCESDLNVNPPLSLAGFVHVEAGYDNQHPWKEIEWLETHCQLPFRSIAFADLAGPFTETVQRLEVYPSVVGIRNIVDSAQVELLSKDSTFHHLKLLSEKQWVFEMGFDLANNAMTQALCHIMKSIPDLCVVVDHATIDVNSMDGEKNLAMLARFDHCYVKCSGWEMVLTEHCTKQAFYQRAKAGVIKALEYFGDKRVLLGSNFPVCLMRARHDECWAMYYRLVQDKVITLEQWISISFSNVANLFGFNKMRVS